MQECRSLQKLEVLEDKLIKTLKYRFGFDELTQLIEGPKDKFVSTICNASELLPKEASCLYDLRTSEHYRITLGEQGCCESRTRQELLEALQFEPPSDVFFNIVTFSHEHILMHVHYETLDMFKVGSVRLPYYRITLDCLPYVVVLIPEFAPYIFIPGGVVSNTSAYVKNKSGKTFSRCEDFVVVGDIVLPEDFSPHDIFGILALYGKKCIKHTCSYTGSKQYEAALRVPTPPSVNRLYKVNQDEVHTSKLRALYRYANQTNMHKSPVAHVRKSHIRHCPSGKIVTVRETMVNANI